MFWEEIVSVIVRKVRFILACVKAHPRTGHEGLEGE
jgi:hypothetical protein